MSDLKHARELLTLAERDLAALRVLADTPVADETFGFHGQQAAEKLFKAWLALLGKTYPITHKLNILLKELRNGNAEVEQFRGLASLTPYAVELRYTHDASKISALDRTQAIQLVEALWEEVQRQITARDGRN